MIENLLLSALVIVYVNLVIVFSYIDNRKNYYKAGIATYSCTILQIIVTMEVTGHYHYFIYWFMIFIHSSTLIQSIDKLINYEQN